MANPPCSSRPDYRVELCRIYPERGLGDGETEFFHQIGGRVKASKLEDLPVEAQIKRVWGDEAKTAIMVSWAENGTRECAREVLEPNGSKSYGVFMLNSVHFKKGYTEQDFKDCTKNIKIAYEFYKQSGWYPWSAWKNGSWKKYK